MSAVHVVVPDGIDDPALPSGGNAYDRRVCRGLATLGWSVHEHPVPGSWPRPDAAARAGLARAIAAVPAGAVVVVDGLIASTVPEVLVPEAARLRLVVITHLPLGGVRERSVLSCAAAVITTSEWTRNWLLDRHALRPSGVHVAEPGVDAARLAAGSAGGGELLCVAAVIPGKGHDVLFEALAAISGSPWRCVCVGALTRDPSFVARLAGQVQAGGIADRVAFAGPRTGPALDAAYAAADALVLASRAETYAMVVTEALARGLPVVATAVGGLPQALGRGADGDRPGLLVPPDDPRALAGALRRWLDDAALRERLRELARERRGTLPGWSATALRVARVLTEVAA